MNKQEAIEEIKNIGTLNIFDKVAGQQVDMVIKNEVLDIVSQIDEPQKVVVPKFVGEWYERNKDSLDPAIYSTITGTYRKLDGENNDLRGTFEGWLLYEYNSILTLVQMHLFGYEIEQEKLYTVEIPDPNSMWKHTCLIRSSTGICISRVDRDNWEKREKHQLTEAEIKKDFEWAWQFAKEVE